ncbi:MAG: riboflavin synthase [Frankiales bacterium]|nr:riboflavin synthase [Frankiales bacterium]
MFTGIVEELGTVVSVERTDDAARIAVRGELVGETSLGDSVAVNGVCLTVAQRSGDEFIADVMDETLRRSSLGELQSGDQVNLERAATLSTRLGGHLVQGHVDGIGRVVDRVIAEAWEVVQVRLDNGLTRYVVEKGSIALDGVSLTVASVTDDVVSVSLIPETLRRTTLGRRAVGDVLNVEVDVLAKHVERLLAARLERA